MEYDGYRGESKGRFWGIGDIKGKREGGGDGDKQTDRMDGEGEKKRGCGNLKIKKVLLAGKE